MVRWVKLLTTDPLLAYTFSVVAWRDWDGRDRRGLPSNPEDAKGLKVLVTNPEDDGDTHQFWALSISTRFRDWSEWWTYIGALMVAHGMELADEPGGDE